MNRAAWKLPIKLALSLGLLLYLFSSTDLEPLWGSLRQAHWPCLLLGLGLVLSGQMMCALKWKLLLKAVGIEPPFVLLVRCYFIGTFFNLFLPGLVGGDFVRGYYLVKGGKETSAVVLSILAERLLGLVCLLGLLRGFLFFYDLPGTLGKSVGPGLSLLLFVLLLLGSGLLFWGSLLQSIHAKRLSEKSERLPLPHPPHREGREGRGLDLQTFRIEAKPAGNLPAETRSMRPSIFSRAAGPTAIKPLAVFSRLLRDFSRFRGHPILVGTAMLLIIGWQILFVMVHILLGHSLGFVVPPTYYFIFVPLSTLLSSLPISFSGLGVRESSYVYFLRLVHIPGPQALSFGLLWLSILLTSGLIGGMVYLGGARIVGGKGE